MIPWVQLDTAAVPGGGSLRLMRRGPEFSIMIGGNELMNSRLGGSEEALATLSLERLAGIAAPRLLVGGLGMGFTLRAALSRLGPDGRVAVAELVPAVVAWAKGPMAEVFAGSLEDSRVTVEMRDVADVVAEARGRYDAILLDVDNGPDGLTAGANDRLYGARGLSAARTALRPGGILAVWSSGPDAGFTARLRKSGFSVEETRARASRTGGGARHIVWLARRPGAAGVESG